MVFQTAGERNYHIFYQLVAGADENPALRDRLMLDGCEAFNYLNQSGVTRIEGQVEEVRDCGSAGRECICDSQGVGRGGGGYCAVVVVVLTSFAGCGRFQNRAT